MLLNNILVIRSIKSNSQNIRVCKGNITYTNIHTPTETFTYTESQYIESERKDLKEHRHELNKSSNEMATKMKTMFVIRHSKEQLGRRKKNSETRDKQTDRIYSYLCIYVYIHMHTYVCIHGAVVVETPATHQIQLNSSFFFSYFFLLIFLCRKDVSKCLGVVYKWYLVFLLQRTVIICVHTLRITSDADIPGYGVEPSVTISHISIPKLQMSDLTENILS